MTQGLFNPETSDRFTPRPAERWTRRALLVAVAGAASGAGFWALRRFTVPAAPLPGSPGGPEWVSVAELAPDGRRLGTASQPRLRLTDAQWRLRLSPGAYAVLRHAATERAYTGALWNQEQPGLFHCAGCGLALFSSAAKFDSGTGWPSFWQPIAPENVVERLDGSVLSVRTAVACRLCDGHLGHVFNDGPPPTGLRYCINSAALIFLPMS